jgi:serine phosphatase RsbU (regulator of sigma subunit)
LPGAAFARNLKPEIVDLVPGDVLIQWTDGATEAADAHGNPYGDHRLYGAVLSLFEKPMQELVDGVAEDVLRFAGGTLADDLTVFALAVLAPASDQPAEGETV